MPYSLIDRHTTPHNGWRYREVRTRTNLTGPTLEVVARSIIKHREANGLFPTGSMDEVMREVEQQICAQAPPQTCRDVENGTVKMSGTPLNFDTIARGANALFDFFVKHGRRKVSVEHATERARICGNCFANRKPEGCTSCATNWLRELSEKIVGGETTIHDPLIHSCSFCGCQLRSLIFMPTEVVKDHTPQSEVDAVPDYCWKKREILGEDILAPKDPEAPKA